MRSMYRLALALLVALLPSTLAQDSLSSSAAQLLVTLPPCALKCLTTAVAASPCSLTNQTCVCTNASLQANVTVCVTESCTLKQALFTKNVTETLCQSTVRNEQGFSYALTVAFAVISAAMVLVRLCFKLFVTSVNPSLDDWFIVITFLSGLPSTVLQTDFVIPNGLGTDIWTLTSDQITNFGMYFYIMAVLYFLQVTLLKMSLLFFYLRIFPDKTVRRFLWGTVWFNAGFGLFFVVLSIFQCQPISFYWTKWDGEHEGKCLGINGIAWANAAVSIALDVWMLTIPLLQLRKLQMHWTKKVGVAIMFIVGTFVTVVSILRMQSLVTFADTQNPTWDYLGVSNWSVVEINVGIICTCMPALRVMLVRLFPALGGTIGKSNKYYAQSGSNNAGKSKGRSRAGTGGQMPSIVHYPEPATTGGQQKQGTIYQQRTYTVQYGDDDNSDQQNLVHMQSLDFKGHKASRASEVSL